MCWAARHGAWTRQSMPCSRTWLYSEESFWQLCHHQTARSDCLRTEAHGSAKIWPDGPPHFNEESPRSATLVKASVCVVQLSGRKQIITLIHLTRLRQAHVIQNKWCFHLLRWKTFVADSVRSCCRRFPLMRPRWTRCTG